MTVPAPRALHILVVDDNPALCDAIVRWLAREPGIASVAAQTDWRGAAARVAAERPDIVLLDIDLPGVSGLDLIAPLSAASPTVKVVMLSGMATRPLVERALDEGAAGYVVKDQDTRTLAELILRAAEGAVTLCPVAEAALAG